jgi:hypothetical protein
MWSTDGRTDMATLIVTFFKPVNVPKSERNILMASRTNKKENIRIVVKQNLSIITYFNRSHIQS